MSPVFKVKPGKRVWIVYRGTKNNPETYTTYHDKPEQDAEKLARKRAYQLNKEAMK